MINDTFYVVYLITAYFKDEDGERVLYYVGKSNKYMRRAHEHMKEILTNKAVRKYNILSQADTVKFEILDWANPDFSEAEKQLWMDNTEKHYIHHYARIIYNTLMGVETNYPSYKPFRKIIEKGLLNKQLY